MITPFLSGAVFCGNLVVALIFLRFWRKTSDRFFALFSVSFLMLALERVVLTVGGFPRETEAAVYLVRMFAFVLILIAVWDKNR